MRKQSENKKRAHSGFTLAETLIAVLLLLMATAIVAGGMPVAQRAYYDVVDTANAEVLFSTTITALQDELGSTQGFALTKSGEGDAAIYSLNYYRSASQQHRRAELMNGKEAAKDGSKGITINYPNDAVQRKLVSVAASTKRLHTEFDSITYDNTKQVFVVSGLKVVREKDNATLAGGDDYEVELRPMNPIVIEQS